MSVFLIKAFVSLFIVIDPLGCLPIYVTLTMDETRKQRRMTALRAVLAAWLILLGFSFAGRSLFHFFGTSMGAFQIAGGILLFTISMNMLKVERSGYSQTVEDEIEDSKGVDDVSLVPLAIPLLAGPSTIATLIVLIEGTPTFSAEFLVIQAMLAAVLLVTYLIFRISGLVNRLLGVKGLLLAMRLMGLILAAVSVQFIAEGFYKLFPVLKEGL